VVFIEDFFDISKNERFIYKVNGHYRDSKNAVHRAFCPVTPTTAKVIAVDGNGRPALLLNSIEKGKVFFSAYPLEYYLANTHEVYKSDNTYRIYKSLCRMTGVVPTFDSLNPYVEIGNIRYKDESRCLLWIINHDWEKREGFIKTGLSIKNIVDFETGESIHFKDRIPFKLPPKEIKVYDIETE